jgi:hypothetical protein
MIARRIPPMKPAAALGIVIAMLAFMGLVIWSTLSEVETECEVCLLFGSEEVCRFGRGPNEVEVLRAAQESACGGNTSGMAEIIRCRGDLPARASCRAL